MFGKLGLFLLTKSALSDLDGIARQYMRCDKPKKQKRLAEEFKETVQYYNERVKRYEDIVPGARGFTQSVVRYIEVRTKDGWRTL